MTTFFIAGMINLFGGLTFWRFFDYFTPFFVNPYDWIFGVYLGLSSLLWLFLLFKFWNKFNEQEAMSRGRV